MKRYEHGQVVSRGLKKIVIDVIYGSPSFYVREDVGLPFVIPREEAGGHYEPEESLIKRAEIKLSEIEKDVINQVEGLRPSASLDTGVRLVYYKFKPKRIKHINFNQSKTRKR